MRFTHYLLFATTNSIPQINFTMHQCAVYIYKWMALIQFNLCLCRFSSWNLEMIETMLWIRRLVLLTTIIVFSGLFCKYLLIILGIELETCSHYHYRNQLNGRYKVFTILINSVGPNVCIWFFFLSDFFVIRFFLAHSISFSQSAMYLAI